MLEKKTDQKFKPIRLLIVDDIVSTRSGLKALLESASRNDLQFEIREAADGKEAIQMTETFHPNIVLMDIQMPHINGIEATRLIKIKCPDVKVIVLTMYASYKNAALIAGADRFLLKGSSPEALLEAVLLEAKL